MKILKEKVLVIDTETNALRNPDKIHVICTRDSEGNTYEFRQPLLNPDVARDFQRHLRDYDWFAGHNIIQYDILHVLDRLLPGHCLNLENTLDSLVISRLINYNRPGGHSIQQYGEEFKVKKIGTEIEQWDELDQLMVDRCHSDTQINWLILDKYWRIITDPEWQPSIELEQYTAYACGIMSRNGIGFDRSAAHSLKERLEGLLAPMDAEIAKAFPPRPVPVREVTPRLTKFGTLNRNDFRWTGDSDLSMFNGGPFTIIRFEEFNTGSPKQVVDRLNEAGWKPTDKTKGHIEALKSKDTPLDRLEYYKQYGWKISEENLATIPDGAPQAAKSIGRRIVLRSRLSDVEEWLNLVEEDENGEPTVFGDFNPIGAWTHRLSHARPNLANIPVARRSPKDTEFQAMVNDFNDEMRGLFKARNGTRLVGTDADGLQMRIFAHYVNDRELIDALIKGTKEDKTDIHSVHQRKLGDNAKSRDAAKTFIYAWLLGAGTAKVAEILECSTRQAKESVANFIESYPGLKELKNTIIPKDAARGYFIGLDGRKVICNNQHLMLAGYLQNGEAVIMKGACREWQGVLDRERIPYRMVTWPHDEWQTEVPDDDSVCAFVQQTQIQAIRNQAEKLGMNCPLEGSSDWGYTWKDTH